jgi:N-acyl-D-amino-acid deacylase
MRPMLDLLVEDALVVDGSGRPARRASVGTRQGRIAWIGPAQAAPEAARSVAAAGRVLAPGFVDVHTHADLSPLVDPWMTSALSQGVTTVVVGNCGASPWPPAGAADCVLMSTGDPSALAPSFGSFGEYLQTIGEARPALNVAASVGHGAVRAEVMGTDARTPTDDELRKMRRLVAEAINDGAVGLSTGLIYAPGIHASTDEIVALAREAARGGAIYASHIRGEGAHLFPAVDEAIEVGRRAGLPVHVSHLKCETSFAWGRADELLARLHAADDATADQYPYTAWESALSSLLPAWAPASELTRLLADRDAAVRLRAAVEHGEAGAFQSSVAGVGWDRIVIGSTSDRRCNGMSIEAIAKARGTSAYRTCLDLLLEDPGTACIGHAMDEEDVRTILADPEVFIASDAVAMSPAGPMGGIPVHPRTYGTFPRVLGRYVRDGTLGLEAAVRKMTSLPAERFGLTGRGLLIEGGAADLVLFDPASVADRSVFGEPHLTPAGIDLVVVNGLIAWDGAPGKRAGEVLRLR